MKPLNIYILTGCFYPRIHPRAFRATELAKEFQRLGHNVTVVNTEHLTDFDEQEYARQIGIKIENLDINIRSTKQTFATTELPTRFSKLKKIFAEWALGGRLLFKAPKFVKRLNISKDADLVIALSTPYLCILGLSRYLRKNRPNNHLVAVADSGDPFYGSRQYKHAFWFYFIEKRSYKELNYLCIPTETAKVSYKGLIPENKIKVIPQAFNMRNLNLYKGERLKPVKFAYAGVFYWDIRNPEFMFQYLDKQEMDYEFHLYMRTKDVIIEDMLDKYPSLKAKTHITISLPREELLYELSRMDFLVNIENLSNTQIPSKLIDYAITKRPIFSCNCQNFSEEKFLHFLNGKYDGAFELDVKKYDIEVVAQQFLDLLKKK